MSPSADSGGFREPRQARSRRTLARMVEATETILVERGPDEVTVRHVVERAGTSVGAFYTRFDSRDDAVAYVHARFWDDVGDRWADFLDPERWRGASAGHLVAEVVRRYARVSLANERSRAFLMELVGRRDEALLGRVRDLDVRIAALVGTLMEERADELAHPRPRQAAEEGFRRVLSAVRDPVLFGAAVDRRAAERLILSLVEMYGGMLGVEERPGTWVEVVRLCAGAGRRPASPGG